MLPSCTRGHLSAVPAPGREERRLKFTPTPAEVRALIKEAYPSPAPLVVQFEVDGLDESPDLSAALPALSAAS